MPASAAVLLSFLMVACSAGEAPYALSTSTAEVCPTCPPPVVITVQPTPTVTSEPSPTATAAPTVVAFPTRAPLYRVQKCVILNPNGPWTFSRQQPVSYTWCVLNIKFGQDGFMMVDVYFSGNAGDSETIINLPPGGVANFYILDDLGNKYDWTNRGGCAQQPITTHSGKGCSGWLTYPIVTRAATTLSFNDDWYASPITGISLVGETSQSAVTPTP